MSVQTINSSASTFRIPRFVKMKRIIIISILGLMLLGGGYGYYLFNKPHQGIADVAPTFRLSATSLVEAYDKDENAANAKYLGKIVEVTGIISEKVKNEKGKYNITLQAADLAGVGCEFDPKSQEEVQNLKEGQEVQIKGICTGVLMDVVLVDCVCVNSEKLTEK
jgi:hypothetical protein